MEEIERRQMEINVCPSGGGGVIYSNSDKNTHSPGETLSSSGLKSVFQPIIDHKHYQLVGFEALSRPFMNGEAISPLEWFQKVTLEQNSSDADLWAIQSACQSFLASSVYSSSPFLFVNLIPLSMENNSFLRDLERVFHLVDFPPEKIVFEIVEYVHVKIPRLAEKIKDLRSLGAKIALDDIGAGTEDLQTLVVMEPDFMKIDRSLVDGIHQSMTKQRLLSALAQYGDSSHLWVAEGIECYEDLTVVKEAGVHLSQGYYWGHPLPQEELSALLVDIEVLRTQLNDAVRGAPNLTDERVLKSSARLDQLILYYTQLSLKHR